MSFFNYHKDKPRQDGSDIGSVIDGASAILSQGGKTAFTVKSGFLSNITVESPKSFFSKRSINSIVQKNMFARYRGRS